MAFKTPILLIAYRRPDTTKQVIDAIRVAAPKRMFVACDGPNFKNPGEAERVAATRALIEREIDWPCKIERRYSDTNQGCKMGPSNAITWFFEQVEEGVILEDDCVAHPDFFPYCAELLERFRHDSRVWHISGDNFQDGNKRTPYSYYFSKYPHCWGWATWRRAWKHWESNSDKWIEFRDMGLMKFICDDPYEKKYWTQIFDWVFLEGGGRPDIWDYQWIFACWSQSGLTALPNVNLVSNIGFGPEGTYCLDDSPYANMAVEDIGEITHPPFVVRHVEGDRYTFDHHFGGKAMKTMTYKLKSCLYKYLSPWERRLKRLWNNPADTLKRAWQKFSKANS